MRRVVARSLFVLAVVATAACTEPDPIVGEFAIEGLLTTDFKPKTCVPPYPEPYCQEAVAINDPVVGTLTVPDTRDQSDPNRYEGVTITIGTASYPYGSATFDHGYLTAGAAQHPSSVPTVILEGSFAGDSIAGAIRVGYGFSAGTFGSRTGTFVARRK